MKSLAMKWLRAAIALAVMLSLPVGLWAGEAIQFSNTKSHPDPNQKATLSGASRPGLSLGSQGPLERLPPGYQSRRRDPRAERKLQNAEDERKNWMVLEPGQLDAQDEEESGFGVREYDLDKKNSKRSYFFAPGDSKGDRLGHPSQQGGRLHGNKRVQQELNAKESSGNSDAEDSNSKGSQSVSKDGRPVGDHISKDLDMKDLLAPGKANSIAPAEDSTTKLWREALGSGAMVESRAEGPAQQGDSVADGFRPSLSGSARAQSAIPSRGFRTDYGARPAAGGSSMPGPSSAGPTPSLSSQSPLAPRYPDSFSSRPAAPPTADRVPTPNGSYSSQPGGFGSGLGNSPYGQQTPPRRAPSSGFEIPARPGYGGR